MQTSTLTINNKIFINCKDNLYITEFDDLPFFVFQCIEILLMICVTGDIGGSMGLFVGASVITVFELGDAILHNFLKMKLEQHKRK